MTAPTCSRGVDGNFDILVAVEREDADRHVRAARGRTNVYGSSERGGPARRLEGLDDILTGGAGPDIFVFKANYGHRYDQAISSSAYDTLRGRRQPLEEARCRSSK